MSWSVTDAPQRNGVVLESGGVTLIVRAVGLTWPQIRAIAERIARTLRSDERLTADLWEIGGAARTLTNPRGPGPGPMK
jgi:hypothetical protein